MLKHPSSRLGEMDEADPLLGSAAARYLASVAMTAIATALAVGVERAVTIPNLSLVFVIPVIIAGLSLGFGPSLLSAILGALAFNFFLTEPRYSLAVDDPSNIWAIGLLFVVGIIISGVAFNARQNVDEVAASRKQADILRGYGRDLIGVDDTTTIVSHTSRALAALFQVAAVVMLVHEDKVEAVQRTGGTDDLQAAELDAGLSSLTNQTVVRAGIYPNENSCFDFWPVKTNHGQSAVIGLLLDPDERPATTDAVVEIVASMLGLALDRQNEYAQH